MGDAYTFGSPRVGSQSWADMNAKLVDIHEGQLWRIVNSDDIVPLVPPSDLKPDVGFYHLDTGVRIFTDYPPAPIPTERGGPPPTGIKVGNIPELLARVLDSSNHCKLCNEFRTKSRSCLLISDQVPTAYYASMVNAIRTTTTQSRTVPPQGPELRSSL